MSTSNYSTTLLVDQSPKDTFNAINDVTGWWSTNFEGSTTQLNDVFTVRFGEVYITMKIVELVPEKKIVWLVTDCNKPWLKNKKEWNGTKISFGITKKNNKTQISFAHLGLSPEIECYGACSNAWSQYLHQSLLGLITTGKGQPTNK